MPSSSLVAKHAVRQDILDQKVYSNVLAHVREAKRPIGITYGTLVTRLGVVPQNPLLHPNDKRLAESLGRVSCHCLQKGLPPITAVVVNQETSLPGKAYYEVMYPHISEHEARIAQWGIDFLAVFKAKWPSAL